MKIKPCTGIIVVLGKTHVIHLRVHQWVKFGIQNVEGLLYPNILRYFRIFRYKASNFLIHSLSSFYWKCHEWLYYVSGIPRMTVTSLSAFKATRYKTHPLCVNPRVPFWMCDETHKLHARWQASSARMRADVSVILEVRQSIDWCFIWAFIIPIASDIVILITSGKVAWERHPKCDLGSCFWCFFMYDTRHIFH